MNQYGTILVGDHHQLPSIQILLPHYQSLIYTHDPFGRRHHHQTPVLLQDYSIPVTLPAWLPASSPALKLICNKFLFICPYINRFNQFDIKLSIPVSTLEPTSAIQLERRRGPLKHTHHREPRRTRVLSW